MAAQLDLHTDQQQANNVYFEPHTVNLFHKNQVEYKDSSTQTINSKKKEKVK